MSLDLNALYLSMCQLEDEKRDWEEDPEVEGVPWEEDNPTDAEELSEIKSLEEQTGYEMLSLRHSHAIEEKEWESFCQGEAYSLLNLPSDFDMYYFDNSTWSEDRKQDYTEVEFMGTTYYVWSNN